MTRERRNLMMFLLVAVCIVLADVWPAALSAALGGVFLVVVVVLALTALVRFCAWAFR